MKYTRFSSRRLIAAVLIFLFLAPGVAAFKASTPPPFVKQSSSGICHDEHSPHYQRTTRYTAFTSLAECLAAGGRLPQGVSAQPVSPAASDGAYKREYFGRGWLDFDGDCRDARQEALAEQSTGQVRFDARGCRVVAGRWISPFTGKVIHDPSAIDIDHVVPLKWAWDRGANTWSQEKRERFANDPVNLLSVEASLNRSKGAKGILEWLPPSGECQYILRFLRVVALYDLKLSSEERAAHTDLRATMCKR